MHEHILSAFALDKSKSLIVVEPLNGTGNPFACHTYLVKKTRRPKPALLRARPAARQSPYYSQILPEAYNFEYKK